MKTLLFVFLLITLPLSALELQGFITKDCQRHVGVVVYASDKSVETVGIDGNFHEYSIDDIETVYIFNLIENPFAVFNIDQAALLRLKSVYVDEDDPEKASLVFPVRFIEDLIIFYSLDGKSHVHRMADIYKLRPAAPAALGEHRTAGSRRTDFDFTEQTAKCPAGPAGRLSEKVVESSVKPTRVLADKISISEFLGSFAQGYEKLESFQERTYLYAKPFLFEPHTRLGLVFSGKREEPGAPLPFYFQWSTGEPYRFQSFNVVGFKNHEFLPNTEPVFSLRSDVKSHAFHALFIGNVAGLAAGSSIFNDSGLKMELKGQVTVQPSFNYLAMMGGDFGPYSLSGGFYYPTFGIKVGNEVREVLGSSASYAVRAMYTKRNLRGRIIGAVTDYQKGAATEDEVTARSDVAPDRLTVQSYKFGAVFVRGGFDYDFSKRLSVSIDGIFVGGNYKETQIYPSSATAQPSDLKFTKFTTQLQVRQSFGRYISLSAFANLIQNNYESNFLNKDLDREQRETRFFGTLEFIF